MHVFRTKLKVLENEVISTLLWNLKVENFLTDFLVQIFILYDGGDWYLIDLHKITEPGISKTNSVNKY